MFRACTLQTHVRSIIINQIIISSQASLYRQIVRKSTPVLKINHTSLGVRTFLAAYRRPFFLNFGNQSVINVTSQLSEICVFGHGFLASVIYVNKLNANPPQACKYTIGHSECGINLSQAFFDEFGNLSAALF